MKINTVFKANHPYYKKKQIFVCRFVCDDFAIGVNNRKETIVVQLQPYVCDLNKLAYVVHILDVDIMNQKDLQSIRESEITTKLKQNFRSGERLVNRLRLYDKINLDEITGEDVQTILEIKKLLSNE